jgi:hypothetical protein
MKIILVPLAAALVLSASLSLAADPPVTRARDVCKADAQKLCSGVEPGSGRILGCLKQNQAQVSAACKDAMSKERDRTAPRAAPAPPQK